MNLKFILSDLDGVIRTFPTERDWSIEQKYNLPRGSLNDMAFSKTDLIGAVCGRISDEQWRESIAENLAKMSDAKTAKLAVEEWSNFAGLIDYEYLKYLNQNFTTTPVVLLTNATTRLKTDLAQLGIKKHFYKIINSAELGFCKPDKKFFEHVLRELSCLPSEILFVDDSEVNIHSARGLGFHVHHYKNLDHFKSELRL